MRSYSKFIEFLLQEIGIDTEKLLLASIYRSPKAGYLNVFQKTLISGFPNYSNLAVSNKLIKEAEISYQSWPFSIAKEDHKTQTFLNKMGIVKDQIPKAPLSVNPEDLNQYLSEIGMDNVEYGDFPQQISFNSDTAKMQQEKFKQNELQLDKILEIISSNVLSTVGIDEIPYDYLRKRTQYRQQYFATYLYILIYYWYISGSFEILTHMSYSQD